MSPVTKRHYNADVVLKVQIANNAKRTKLGKPSYRITIPNLGTEWYRRIIHPNGKIELIPIEMMEASTGAEENGD